MKKRLLTAALTGALVLAVAATAVAVTARQHTITCPSCGAEIEMPEKEERGGFGQGPMSAESYKAMLDEKVASGDMTQEDADAKLSEFQAREQEMEARRTEMEQKMAEKKAELDEKVASGELTQEEADKQLRGGHMGRGPEDGMPEGGKAVGFRGGPGRGPHSENNDAGGTDITGQ